MLRRTFLSVFMLAAMPGVAAVRPMTFEERQKAASRIVTGTVVSKTESHPDKPVEVKIYGVVEILVESVQKGSDVKVGERVAVHYWRMEPDPIRPVIGGHYGQYFIPAEADRVQVFVKTKLSSGFSVLEPNGFEKTQP